MYWIVNVIQAVSKFKSALNKKMNYSAYFSALSGALDMATTIASMSPVAVQNTKTTLIHARDHSVQEGLDYVVCLLLWLFFGDDY